jgi:hypothetical protein
MSIGVLARKSIEWTHLYHFDQASTDLKVLALRLTAGPVGTLATARTENSQRDFWAMVVVVADTDVSGAVVVGMTEEVGAKSSSSLGVPLDCQQSFSASRDHSYTILF